MDDTLVHPGARQRRRSMPGCVGLLFNLLALVLVVMTCANGLAIASVFVNPSIVGIIPGGNSWVPPSFPTAIVRITPGPSPTVRRAPGVPVFPTLPPEWTPTDTPTVTNTPVPPTETPTATSTEPFPTRTPRRTPTSTPSPTRRGPAPTASRTRTPFNYTLQNNAPTYLANFVNSNGCQWFGIAGQVFGLDGRPVIGLNVHLEGGGVNVDALTGSAPQVGTGGYLIGISDHPIETTDTYKVQLRNNTGTALSQNYTIRTFGDCTRNLVLVNFVQDH